MLALTATGTARSSPATSAAMSPLSWGLKPLGDHLLMGGMMAVIPPINRESHSCFETPRVIL